MNQYGIELVIYRNFVIFESLTDAYTTSYILIYGQGQVHGCGG